MNLIKGLTDIYTLSDIRVWRCGDNAIVLPHGAVCVVRPWDWELVAQPDFPALAPDAVKTPLARWASTRSSHVGGATLGELLVWASKRSQPTGGCPQCEEVKRAPDIQPCGPAAYNRLLICEALQVWVETEKASLRIDLRLLPAPGQTVLAMTAASITCFLASYELCGRSRSDAKCGADEMPGGMVQL